MTTLPLPSAWHPSLSSWTWQSSTATPLLAASPIRSASVGGVVGQAVTHSAQPLLDLTAPPSLQSPSFSPNQKASPSFSPNQKASHSSANNNMACLETISSTTTTSSTIHPPPLEEETMLVVHSSRTGNSPDKPRRNLTQAFEALCVDTRDDALLTGPDLLSPEAAAASTTAPSPALAKAVNLISPTGVTAEFTLAAAALLAGDALAIPRLSFHPDLKKELSDHLVQRVSCYSIIHDINKEAAALASHDPLSPANMSCNGSVGNEDDSPLIMAMMGDQARAAASSPAPGCIAVIDEEEWLLRVLEQRLPEETDRGVRHCPPTFLQAMGEKEYENPVTSVTGHARTQLWKPSRSWWEAKSGKNPWIEPNSHNKRWRYLWPLIHYHKFLAKCIKKLKRNGVDVKQAVSPLAVFLREEVCAVSDHLALVSLFGSEEWMSCLNHFSGWIVMTDEAEKMYRTYVKSLKLRSIQEPADVDSPLLRSQIDQNFLRAMAVQREQMREAPCATISTAKKSSNRSVATSTLAPAASGGPPPMYPRGSPAHKKQDVPEMIQGVRRPRFCPPWWEGWDQQGNPLPPPPFGDNSSVQSALSMDSYSQMQAPTAPFDYRMYPTHAYYGPPHQLHHHMAYPPHDVASHPMNGYPYQGMDPQLYNPHAAGWMDPATAYALQSPHPNSMDGYYSAAVSLAPSSPATFHHVRDPAVYPSGVYHEHNMGETPSKTDDPDSVNGTVSQSPYWAHLDQATLAMALATPAKASPTTPTRNEKAEPLENETADSSDSDGAKESGFVANAQPLLLRHQYYGYHAYGPPERYGPPSPATQFLMSPQASFAFSHGYGYSPRRNTRSTPRANKKVSALTTVDSSPPGDESIVSQPSVDADKLPERESPSTVETATETESMQEVAA